MKILLFTLLPLFATAQMPEIKIGKCAGKDPILLWGGGGPDFGEFTMVVGEDPCDGTYFTVEVGANNSISRIETWNKLRDLPEKYDTKSNSRSEGNASIAGTFHGLKHGDIIHVRYCVTRKKEPRT